MLYLPLDRLARQYDQFYRSQRVFRGASSYGVMTMVMAALFPFLYSYVPALQHIVFSIAKLFLEVRSDFLISPLEVEGFPFSRAYVMLYTALIIPFSVFTFYLYFFVYGKLARFSRVTAWIIILYFCAVLFLAPLAHLHSAELISNVAVDFLFVVTGSIMALYLGWLTIRGLLVITKTTVLTLVHCWLFPRRRLLFFYR